MRKKNILKKLQEIIGWFDEHKHELGILSNEKDFTRASRKMSFIDVIYSVIGLKCGKTKNELIDYFECSLKTITSVGYYLARCKVKPEVFHMILKKINETFKAAKRIKGHRLIAFDGSDLLTYVDKDDYETHSSLREGSKGCNMVHINAAYDVLNNIYVDVEVQTLRNKNETGALIEMIKRTDIEKGAIITADRGYESYNVLEWVRNLGYYFLIRGKDIDSKNSIAQRFLYNLPEDKEFDEEVTVFITKRQCKETLSNPDKYIVISRSSNFDFINKENPYYEATYRIARFKIGNGNYETIFTNLSKEEFSLKEIKELYHARWGIETSFRNLKYEIGLNALHSKKIDLVLQEIYGKMIRFNISMIITQEAEKHMKHKKERKYGYAINVSTAIHIVQKFFTKKKRGLPPHIYKLIAKEIVPIRSDRSFDRVVETQSFIPFGCRLSY